MSLSRDAALPVISWASNRDDSVIAGLDLDRLYRPDVSIHAGGSRAAGRGPGAAVLERPRSGRRRWKSPSTSRSRRRFLTIQELPSRKLVTSMEVLLARTRRRQAARDGISGEATRSAAVEGQPRRDRSSARRGADAPEDVPPSERLSDHDLPAEAGGRAPIFTAFDWRDSNPSDPDPAFARRGRADPRLERRASRPHRSGVL